MWWNRDDSADFPPVQEFVQVMVDRGEIMDIQAISGHFPYVHILAKRFPRVSVFGQIYAPMAAKVPSAYQSFGED